MAEAKTTEMVNMVVEELSGIIRDHEQGRK